MMVRTVAFEGYAIIIGQGGTAATGDLANGLSIRVEAPRDWRVARICRRDIWISRPPSRKSWKSRKNASICGKSMSGRIPGQLYLTWCSIMRLFTNEAIADMIVKAMEEKGLVEKQA